MNTIPKISHCIWFDANGEEAAQFYAALFEDAEILASSRYTKESAQATGKQEGDAMAVSFRLANLEFLALNAGPMFHPTPAVSYFINCENGADVDHYWNVLTEGGKVLMPLDEYSFSKRYGWVQDKFGVSWQVMHTDPIGGWRPKLIPCLLFTGKKSGMAREAVALYTSIFKVSERGQMIPYVQPGQEHKTQFADFRIAGQWIAAMDSPQDDPFDFTEGNSFMVHCEDQDEIDYFWERLTTNGGAESQCGWLKDRFGISWQIISKKLNQMLRSPEAVAAMMKMKRLDIAALEQAGGGH